MQSDYYCAFVYLQQQLKSPLQTPCTPQYNDFEDGAYDVLMPNPDAVHFQIEPRLLRFVSLVRLGKVQHLLCFHA